MREENKPADAEAMRRAHLTATREMRIRGLAAVMMGTNGEGHGVVSRASCERYLAPAARVIDALDALPEEKGHLAWLSEDQAARSNGQDASRATFDSCLRILREEAARQVSGEIPGVEWDIESSTHTAYICEDVAREVRDSVRLSVGNNAAEVPGDLYIECSEGDAEAMMRVTRDQVRDTLVPLLQRFVSTGKLRGES
jgi:hypothetical protein